jgi:membrane-bound lytic murein transglycosylase MltF
MNTDTRPTRWSPIADAAVELGVSTRTVQRHIEKGKLRARTVDGRTLVAMPDDATPGTVGAVVAGLQQQVETTDRMSSALLVVAERNIELMVARADRAERTARVRGVVAVAASVVAAAGLAWAVATTRQASDTLTRLDAARAELAQQEQELATATRDRQLSIDAAAAARTERDLLVEELVALRACLSDNADTVVAATGP